MFTFCQGFYLFRIFPRPLASLASRRWAVQRSPEAVSAGKGEDGSQVFMLPRSWGNGHPSGSPSPWDSARPAVSRPCASQAVVTKAEGHPQQPPRLNSQWSTPWGKFSDVQFGDDHLRTTSFFIIKERNSIPVV